MGKFSELDTAIRELRRAATTINDVADSIAAMFNGATAEDVPPQKTPITLEQVRAVLAEKSRAGKTAAVKELLRKHGADKLSDIDPSEYAALLAEAEVL